MLRWIVWIDEESLKSVGSAEPEEDDDVVRVREPGRCVNIRVSVSVSHIHQRVLGDCRVEWV